MGRSLGRFGGSPLRRLVDRRRQGPRPDTPSTSARRGLGLPDRDYYLRAGFAEKKAKYQAYVAADADAGRLGRTRRRTPRPIVAFETQLAEAQLDAREQRDRDKTYNPMTLAELTALAPGFDWTAYLAAADLGRRPRA